MESTTTDDPRFALITPNDHGGILVIIATLLMTGMLLFLGIRIYTRMLLGGGLGLDDYVLTFSSVLAVAQTVATLYSVNRGFGKKTDLIDDQVVRIPQLETSTYAGDILFVIAVTLSKCAVCLLIKRLTQTEKHQLVAYVILGASIIWGLASTLTISIRTPIDKPWRLLNKDPVNVLLRWRIVGALDILTELALSALSVFLVWSLQMPIRNKLIVVTAFSFRLSIVAPIIARINYLAALQTSDNHNLFFALVPATLCTQIELHLGLMAATIPCLKPFMRAANTGYMGFGGAFIERTHHDTNSYPLSSMKSGTSRRGEKSVITSSTATATTGSAAANNNNEGDSSRKGDSNSGGGDRNDKRNFGRDGNTNANNTSTTGREPSSRRRRSSFLGAAGNWTRIVAPSTPFPKTKRKKGVSRSQQLDGDNQLHGSNQRTAGSLSPGDNDSDGSEVGIIRQTTSFTVEYHENERVTRGGNGKFGR
ncbi:hypothetical protein AJ79_02019 [Helicocarpus griseus UAMH5409]|uniref:Rhodopsin domain-containing protein n=1 Tax=Helicocarpus griseus UAMH5409 TaxID=1447875 RepID=A0A2B7Y4G7_9EURO|nr:hypothetical protein AJ79_02019 [Helicocarpus griseus UAMH5409]